MVHAERDARRVGERRLLADVEVERRLRDLDGGRGDGIQGLQAGHDLAGAERLDLELVVGGFRHVLREGLRGAINGVERFREARGQAPFQLGHGLRDGGGGDERGAGGGQRAALEECAAFHGDPP